MCVFHGEGPDLKGRPQISYLSHLEFLLSTRSLLRLDRATVRYGDNTVLKCVDLKVESGESVALVGPSGAGKSTLLGVCNGTVSLASGSAFFAGEIIADTDAWRKSSGRKIATIYQQLHLGGRLKVVHNVNAGKLGQWSTWQALGSLVKPREMKEVLVLLHRLGIADKVRMRTDLLSGGEQQRVAIDLKRLRPPIQIRPKIFACGRWSSWIFVRQ